MKNLVLVVNEESVASKFFDSAFVIKINLSKR